MFVNNDVQLRIITVFRQEMNNKVILLSINNYISLIISGILLVSYYILYILFRQIYDETIAKIYLAGFLLCCVHSVLWWDIAYKHFSVIARFKERNSLAIPWVRWWSEVNPLNAIYRCIGPHTVSDRFYPLRGHINCELFLACFGFLQRNARCPDRSSWTGHLSHLHRKFVVAFWLTGVFIRCGKHCCLIK